MAPPDSIALDEQGLFAVQALIQDVRDKVVTAVLKRGQLDTADVFRIRRIIDEYPVDEVGEYMEKTLSKYQRWAFEEGVETINALLEDANLTTTLRVPDTHLDTTRGLDVNKIKTIPAELLPAVKDKLSLAFLGQRTPQDVARIITREFDTSLRRAEVIVRTEIGKLQNLGAQKRMNDVWSKAQLVGIPMHKEWIHSSGSKVPGRFGKGKRRAVYDPRPHHKTLHGVRVLPDEKFHMVTPLGDEYWIDGPHDPVLPPAEVINCYCKRTLRISRERIKMR